MNRITNAQLEAVCERINRLTDSPLTPWTRKDGRNVANIGNYHVSGAYGGVTLHRMETVGGGVSTPLGGGYCTKRELFDKMHAFASGIQTAQQ